MNLENLTEAEVIHKLEQKFGNDLSFISYVGRNLNGHRVFSCFDLGIPSTVTVADDDGYVVSKLNSAKFGDVLGQIK